MFIALIKLMKKCKNCNLTKSLNDFYENRMLKDGHFSKCKECFRSYNLNYQIKLANKEMSVKKKTLGLNATGSE